jgi:hypothetical protein
MKGLLNIRDNLMMISVGGMSAMLITCVGCLLEHDPLMGISLDGMSAVKLT